MRVIAPDLRPLLPQHQGEFQGWPKSRDLAQRFGVLTESPYQRSELGPRFVPTLCDVCDQDDEATGVHARGRDARQQQYGPGPPQRLSALSLFHSKSFLYGAFVWTVGRAGRLAA
jgi:hypothetical protein